MSRRCTPRSSDQANDASTYVRAVGDGWLQQVATKIVPRRAASRLRRGCLPLGRSSWSTTRRSTDDETTKDNEMSTGKEVDARCYGSWPRGVGGETRVGLAIRNGLPVIDIRYGETNNGHWQPSPRGVSFQIEDAASLIRALRALERDAVRLGLKDAGYTKQHVPRRRHRWGR